MPNPFLLPSQPPDVLNPATTGGQPTIFQLGSWRTLDDSFQPHPSSPTGAILDLNDGQTWSLVDDDSGDALGRGLNLGTPTPTVYTSSNPRTVGERVTKRTYQTNRTITAKLFLGQALTYSSFITAMHNLVQTCEGISPTSPGALKIQVVQAGAPVYADVLEAHIETEYKEVLWSQLLDDGITASFVCRPFLRGPRQTLQNYAVNPGFEAPSGPGVQVFSDTFANVNAYVVESGSTPTLSPANTYVDIVQANSSGSLIRYFRLGETSGTTLSDIGGLGAGGTTHGSPTLGTTGLISGDTDGAITFASASSQYVSMNAETAFPTGNGAMTLLAWFQIAANPAASAVIWGYGDATTAHHALDLYVTSGGNLKADIGGGSTSVTSVATITTGVPHLACVTWDGTTMSLYLDNAAAVTATPGTQVIGTNPTVNLAATGGIASFFNGILDEACICSTALTSTQIGTIYTAGHTGATGTLAGAMTIPASTRVQFGSPIWGAINTWQIRFRWVSGQQSNFILHLLNGTNLLYCNVTGTAVSLNHNVAGTNHVQATQSVTLTHEAWYWLQITQYPCVNPPTLGYFPFVQAALLSDNEGAPGSQVTLVGPVVTADGVIAVVGAPSLQTVSGTLVIGGSASNVHTVSLFGPGGWWFQGQLATFSPSSGAWEQTAANTLPSGPVTSFAAARVDCVPAGTVTAYWFNANTSTTSAVQSTAMAAVPNNTYAASVWVKSSGIGSGCNQYLAIEEYDSGGNFLREDTLQLVTGAHGAWTPLSGSVAVGNTCAFVVLALRVEDTNGGSPSANGTVWWDNAQLWNVTSTGQSTMPYCELRFPQSPAQLLVSGIMGDVPSPAFMGLSTFLASAPAGTTLSWVLGRRQQSARGAQMVGTPVGESSGLTITPVVDSTSYAGYYYSVNIGSVSEFRPTMITFHPSDMQGRYHLWARMQTQQSSGNLHNILGGVVAWQQLHPYTGLGNDEDFIGLYIGAVVNPFTASNTWAAIDMGYLAVPIAHTGALTDLTQTYVTPFPDIVDLTSGTSIAFVNWCMLVPLDGNVLSGNAINATLIAQPITDEWIWLYADGLGVNAGQAGAWSYSIETGALPAPGHGGGIPGTGHGVGFAVNPVTDSYISLDPAQLADGTGGVAQFAGLLTDAAAAIYALHTELIYTPLYLNPR